MLQVDDARAIGLEWRAKFIDPAAFDLSWSRYFDMTGNPEAASLVAWLRKDQAKDEVKQAGVIRTPLLPMRQNYSLTDCGHCGGTGYVRDDVPVDSEGFGRAKRCPACDDPHHPEQCVVCRGLLSGYFGPETVLVPVAEGVAG